MHTARPLIALLAIASFAACGRPPAEPAEAEPPVRVRIGSHDVSLRVPEGWNRFDHGLEHRIERGSAQISIADFGPVTPEGYLREIREARLLFQERQLHDAQNALDRVRLRPAFVSDRRWQELSKPWGIIRDGGIKRDLDPGEVQAAYATIVHHVVSLEPPSFPEIVERAMPQLGHGPQRDVSMRRPIEIDGREGMLVETWDRLSHDHPKSYLFALNDERLLVIRMELGPASELRPVFDTLVESLRFHE